MLHKKRCDQVIKVEKIGLVEKTDKWRKHEPMKKIDLGYLDAFNISLMTFCQYKSRTECSGGNTDKWKEQM